MSALGNKKIIAQLRNDLLQLQTIRQYQQERCIRLGVPELERAFPGARFPISAVHEFLSYAWEDAAATNGFITGVLSQLMASDGYCLWVSNRKSVYAPALRRFGIAPHRVLFIESFKRADLLWILEEALKCGALAAVVAEVPDLNFTESRRLQLAVEHSQVTGFIHRYFPCNENTLACMSRWRIQALPSYHTEGLPGLGFPRWKVSLLKIKNGQPGSWPITWNGQAFELVHSTPASMPLSTEVYG
jgi:protein ImuA